MTIHTIGSEPLVTALICNYNYGRFLADAINSALDQTWANLEVIVVDDGSTDNSREVLQRYTDKIRVILKENGGQASAFNAGVAVATGDIICFLDSDDMWCSNKIESVVEKFFEAEWGLVCHDYSHIDLNGLPLSADIEKSISKAPLLSGSVFDYVVNNHLRWVFSPTSGIGISAAIARKLFPLPESDFRLCADSPLAYGAICFGNVGVIDKQLFKYRLHGNNGFSSLPEQHEKMEINRVVNLVNHVKNYLYMIDICKRASRDLPHEPNEYYYFYRLAVFFAKAHPYRHLYKLAKTNILTHYKYRSEFRHPLITSIFLIADDIANAFLFYFGRKSSFSKGRELFGQIKSNAPHSCISYLIK